VVVELKQSVDWASGVDSDAGWSMFPINIIAVIKVILTLKCRKISRKSTLNHAGLRQSYAISEYKYFSVPLSGVICGGYLHYVL
jgi:hypothetical protein